MPEKSSFNANMPSLVTFARRCFQNDSCETSTEHCGGCTATATSVVTLDLWSLNGQCQPLLEPSTLLSLSQNCSFTDPPGTRLFQMDITLGILSTWIMSSTTQPEPGRTEPPQQSLGVQGMSQCSCLLLNPMSILSIFWFHSDLLFHKDRLCHTPVPSYSISSLELYRANIHPPHWTQAFSIHQCVEWINIPTYHPPFNFILLHWVFSAPLVQPVRFFE